MTPEGSGKEGKDQLKFLGVPPDTSDLDPEKQHQIILRYILERFNSSRELQQTAQQALNDAINRAKETQCWIKTSNMIMFFFGIVLIAIAVYQGYTTDKAAYSVLFGGVGFLQIVASFFVGSMQRSQKAISDLIQVEVAYLNYFEQVTLWEQYASIKDTTTNKIDKANLEKAADKIHACAKETLELLQKEIEDAAAQ